MALFIAKAPQYRASQTVPRQIGTRFADLRPSRAENQAIERFGSLLVLRANEMKQERDAAVVGDLYNQWRDADREQLSALLSKKGKDAVDLDRDYDTFYNESSGKADQQAENGTQQRALKNILNRKRHQNLDILARYESQEGQRYRAQQEIGFVENAVADAREYGFDDRALEDTMIGTFDYVESAHPGMGPEALEALNRKYRSQILYANMQSRINEDPARALKDIEGWKEALGEGYFTLKNNAEVGAKQQLVESLRNELNVKHTDGLTPDFDAMEDEIQQSDFPDEIKDSVVVWVRSQEREFKVREKEAKDTTQDAEMDTIFGHIRGGKIPDAYQAVLQSTQLTETQKFRIEKIIKSETEGLGETDSQVYIDTAQAAMRGEIDRDGIINLIGNGLSVPDGENLLNELKKALEPGRKELNNLISNAEDAIEEQIKKGSQIVGYTPGSVDDAYKAIIDFQKQIANPPQGATVEEMLDPESEHYIVSDVVKNNTPTLQQQMDRLVEPYRTQGTKPRKTDESLEDYENRK
ncbi:MAG: hypothetical protein BBJ57_02155 [Desulfobacterales bacterium PC51MH44]|nr:MAG: hypothetical protein BBJ57_02155 [Desulfobacterales bacterium PC51MH44]